MINCTPATVIPAPIERAQDLWDKNQPVTCGICFDNFSRADFDNGNAWTHIGGENHDPFHKFCLIPWLEIKNTCPYNDSSIDLSSFPLSLKERLILQLPTLEATAIFSSALIALAWMTPQAIAAPLMDSILDTAISTLMVAGGILTTVGVGLLMVEQCCGISFDAVLQRRLP